jgi:hypothetical protein
MNKTRFTVEIYAKGDANATILRMVTNHNEGTVPVTMLMLQMMFYGRHCEYPTITPKPHIEHVSNHEMHFYEGDEDKRKHTLTIIEKEIVGQVDLHEQPAQQPDSMEAPTIFRNTHNNLQTTHY